MTRSMRGDRNNDGTRPRWSGGQSAATREHGTACEFPSWWESIEEDVSDHFDDWWRL